MKTIEEILADARQQALGVPVRGIGKATGPWPTPWPPKTWAICERRWGNPYGRVDWHYVGLRRG